MRWLVPGTPTANSLEETYEWPSAHWVRACMVMTLDGSFTGPDGLSGSISSDTDRAVFSAIRRDADAYLVGARTVRLERYSAVRARAEAADIRTERGQAPAPTLVVVSASCRFDWESVAFTGSDVRPIILTVETSEPADRAAAERWCDVSVVGESHVEPAAALAELTARGLTRVTCEGGDSLLGEMIRADVLDELDLTIAPMLTAAPRAARSVPGVNKQMYLHQLVEDEGCLFARYLRRD